MKALKYLFVGVIALVALALAVAYGTGNGFLVRATAMTYLQGHATANINDHVAFDVNVIATDAPSPLPNSRLYNRHPLPADFRARLERFGTAAFLVVHHGEVVSESYFGEYHNRSRTNSFSMAKTVTTLLTGIAIEEGYLDGLNQPMTDLLPEFADDPLGNTATVGQLSAMNSGYEWVEHYYSPLSPTVELLYGADVETFLLGGHFTAHAGTFWEYSSASTQLLAIALRRALRAGGAYTTLSEYLSEKIWQPLGMNDDALWHTDKAGMELAFCCINSNARNFARLGMLMLNNGEWNGEQLVPAHFIAQMTQPLAAGNYGLSTWLNPGNDPAYYWFSGHLGQYIISVPEHHLVIVRLGESRDNSIDFRQIELPRYVDLAMRLAEIDS